MTTFYMTTTEAWHGGKEPAWAKCEPGTHPYTAEVFPARQHTQTDGVGAKQRADVLAQHTQCFELDLDLYKDGATEKWEAAPIRAWIGDRRPYLERGTEGSLKFLIVVPDEIAGVWWPFASGLGWGEIRSCGIVPSAGSLHGKSGQTYDAVEGPDRLIYPDGEIIYSNAIVLDWAGVEALTQNGARNKLAEDLVEGRADLPDDDGRCSRVYAWFQDPEHFNSSSPRGEHANKAVNYLKQADAEGHRLGGWIDDVVARLPHTSMKDFEDMWRTAPVKAGTVAVPHDCCQEITLTYTPPVQPLQPPTVPVVNGQVPVQPMQPQTREGQIRAAMLTWTQIRDTPRPKAVIQDWLFADTLAWIKGPPGGGKSLAAIDMAGCIKTGKPWHGFPVDQGEVLYLVLEGKASIAQRVAAWMHHNADVKPEGYSFSPVPVNLMDSTDRDAIANIAYQMKPKFVVVDTQARATPGAEENSSKDMGLLVASLDIIRQASGACVAVVHHEGRAGEHLRGSTALPGAASTIIDCAKTGTTVTLTTRESKGGRQKDAPENPPFELTMIPAGPGMALSLPTGLAAIARLSEHERQVLDLLAEAGTWMSKSEIAEHLKIPKTTLAGKLWKLRDGGRIEEKEHGMSKMYRLPEVRKTDSLPDEGG